MFRRLHPGFFPRRFSPAAGILLAVCFLMPAGRTAEPPTAAPLPIAGPPPPRDGANRPAPEGSGLTSEERDRVRQVLSEVWSEPQVVEAREAVHQATIKYRDSIRAAVEKRDPSLVPLMEKMHRNIESAAGKHRFGPGGNWPGRPPGPLPPNPKEALERLLEHDPGFTQLDRASRKRLLELAHDTAKASDLQDLLATAIRVSEPAEAALQARRAFREKLVEAMIARDPWVEQALRHPGGKGRGRAEGGSPGAGAPQPPPPR